MCYNSNGRRRDENDTGMIFVILGTQKFQMNRLLTAVDALAADNVDLSFVAQTGLSDYIPKHYPYRRFFDRPLFDQHIADAEIIVTHGGVNSIITALRCEKPVIVCPRLAKYGEHVDDHQREIASAFEKKGLVLVCGEGGDLAAAIAQCKNHTFAKYEMRTEHVTQIINNYLDRFEKS